MAVALHRRSFTVEEYHTMLAAGILTEDDRVELIEGEILEMTPIGSRHAGCVNLLTRLLVTGVGNRAVVTVQNPIRLNDLSEPQPDLALLRPREDDYRSSHPTPADVHLVIEVAEASRDFDRRVKVHLYARSGIPEVWIVDLAEAVLEIHRSPAGGVYREVRRVRAGEVAAPEAFPEVSVDVAALLR